MKRRQLLQLAGAAVLLGGCGEPAAVAAVTAGRPLPAFELPDLSGRAVHPGGDGKPLLLNFWATWCPPCRAEMGSLDRLYRRWRDAGLAVFGISVDDDANLVREFVFRHDLAFPILLDPAAALTQTTLALYSLPTTVLVGRDGRVAEVVVGERRWDEPPTEDAVRTLLR